MANTKSAASKNEPDYSWVKKLADLFIKTAKETPTKDKDGNDLDPSKWNWINVGKSYSVTFPSGEVIKVSFKTALLRIAEARKVDLPENEYGIDFKELGLAVKGTKFGAIISTSTFVGESKTFTPKTKTYNFGSF